MLELFNVKSCKKKKSNDFNKSFLKISIGNNDNLLYETNNNLIDKLKKNKNKRNVVKNVQKLKYKFCGNNNIQLLGNNFVKDKINNKKCRIILFRLNFFSKR